MNKVGSLSPNHDPAHQEEHEAAGAAWGRGCDKPNGEEKAAQPGTGAPGWEGQEGEEPTGGLSSGSDRRAWELCRAVWERCSRPTLEVLEMPRAGPRVGSEGRPRGQKMGMQDSLTPTLDLEVDVEQVPGLGAGPPVRGYPEFLVVAGC